MKKYIIRIEDRQNIKTFLDKTVQQRTVKLSQAITLGSLKTCKAVIKFIKTANYFNKCKFIILLSSTPNLLSYTIVASKPRQNQCLFEF